jgi:hypothetical protein
MTDSRHDLARRARCTKQRLQNRWWDLLAILAGYCNDRPDKTGVPGEGGGWIHWRCALRRGHGDVHRSRNNVWDDQGKPLHLPVRDHPAQPWDRHMIRTRRQERLNQQWLERQWAAMRAKRQTTPSDPSGSPDA